MKVKNVKCSHRPGTRTDIVEFDNLMDFWKYISETQTNSAFSWRSDLTDSMKTGSSKLDFTKTNTFEEAVELLKNGWSEMAAKINHQLNVKKLTAGTMMQQRNKLSVEGFQAVVPMYLNNQPNAMFSRKMVPVKQKVVTLVKNIGYSGYVSADTIIEESVKCLRIVNKIEQSGIRVNLDIVDGTNESSLELITRIRLKSAGERMNVSKMAFPLVHPSMLRRLYFRMTEVYPSITKEFNFGYGRPTNDSQLRSYMSKDEYLLPAFVKKNVDEITTINDLENL